MATRRKTPEQYLHDHAAFCSSFTRRSCAGTVSYVKGTKLFTYSGMQAEIHKHMKKTVAKIKEIHFEEFKALDASSKV